MVYVSIQPVCSDKIVSNPLASPSALCVSSLPNALCSPSVNIICVLPVSHASTMYAISKIPVPLQTPISEKNTTIAWQIKLLNSMNYDRVLFVAANGGTLSPSATCPHTPSLVERTRILHVISFGEGCGETQCPHREEMNFTRSLRETVNYTSIPWKTVNYTPS